MITLAVTFDKIHNTYKRFKQLILYDYLDFETTSMKHIERTQQVEQTVNNTIVCIIIFMEFLICTRSITKIATS